MMATELDVTLIPEILAIVTEYGKDVIFEVPQLSEYDHSSGGVTETGPARHTKKVTPPANYDRKYIDGGSILAEDMQIFLPASELEFVPTKNCKVTVDNQVYVVVSIRPYYTGESIAIYELQLRR